MLESGRCDRLLYVTASKSKVITPNYQAIVYDGSMQVVISGRLLNAAN